MKGNVSQFFFNNKAAIVRFLLSLGGSKHVTSVYNSPF